MKKILPFILLGFGVLVLVAVYFLVVRKPDVEDGVIVDDTSSLIEVAIVDRPVAILTPRADGHWLDLTVSKLGKFEAESLDYELVYKVPDKGQQGTGGSLPLVSDMIEKEILLGTESSGNYYYDTGVEEGTLTLKFRNDKGKLIARFVTDFHFQTDTDSVSSLDGKFVVTLDDESDEYFIVMDTFGIPDGLETQIGFGPFGVFSSSVSSMDGDTNLDGTVKVWSESWNDASPIIPASGIFVTTK